MLSGHKLQANDGRATEMREAWHEPRQPGTRRKKNALTEAVSEERECGIRRGDEGGERLHCKLSLCCLILSFFIALFPSLLTRL